MKKIIFYIKFCTGIAVVLIIALGFHSFRSCSNSTNNIFSFSSARSKKIGLTPAQIRSIERIGQWEFLSIDDEELVDTARHHLFTRNDHLARIYKGTLRLGIDFDECHEGWISMEDENDSIIVTLPPIRLLDRNFIDEARSISFYEQGNWDAQTHEDMYMRAQQRMISRSVTPQNIKKAEENARTQVEALFRALGYSAVQITVSQTSSQP